MTYACNLPILADPPVSHFLSPSLSLPISLSPLTSLIIKPVNMSHNHQEWLPQQCPCPHLYFYLPVSPSLTLYLCSPLPQLTSVLVCDPTTEHLLKRDNLSCFPTISPPFPLLFPPLPSHLCPWYVTEPTGVPTTAVPVQNTSSACSSSCTETKRSATWEREGTRAEGRGVNEGGGRVSFL